MMILNMSHLSYLSSSRNSPTLRSNLCEINYEKIAVLSLSKLQILFLCVYTNKTIFQHSSLLQPCKKFKHLNVI